MKINVITQEINSALIAKVINKYNPTRQNTKNKVSPYNPKYSLTENLLSYLLFQVKYLKKE